MKRKLWLFPMLWLGAWMGGCPTGPQPGDENIPPGDPVITPQPFLSINSTASFLQRNELNLPQPQFPATATLTAVLSNALASSINWTIQSSEPSIIRFVDAQGNPQTTAAGNTVVVAAIQAPQNQVSHQVIATANLTDGTTLQASIAIVVRQDPLVSGESNILTATPTADPVVGVGSNGQVTLGAGISGAVGNVLVDWSPVDPAGIPDGITLPSDLDTEAIVIGVADDVSGVFPFRVVVQDSIGQLATGIVNLFLNVVDLTLDVSVTRVQLNPTSTIELRTIRAGGVPDLNDNEDTNFSYIWQVLDEDNTDVTGLATFSPGASVLNDANVIDWTVTGLPAGAYRFVLTVVDRLNNQQTQSASILLSDLLNVTAAPSVDQVGSEASFRVRTFRTGGQGPFRYDFEVRNSAAADVTDQTGFTPPSGTVANGVTNDWILDGFETESTYRVFVTVTDGAGNTSTSSATVRVGDVLSLDVKADDLFVDPGEDTTISFDVHGGVAPYNFTFNTVTTQAGVASFAPGSPQNNQPGDLSVTWTAPGAGVNVNGPYRVEVTVTDANGNAAQDSALIQVGGSGGGGGASFTVDVTAQFAEIGPDAAYNGLLRTNRLGGSPNFSWDWAVIDESGADVFGNAAGEIDVALSGGSTLNDAVITWDVTVGSNVPPGTYRFEATATDGNGDDSIGSTEILINDPVTVTLSARATLVAPGVPVEITATPSGGSGNYSYAFTNAVDAEGDPAGAIGADPPDGATGATVWDAPADGSGTYTLGVTVTDTTLNTTATTSLPITVTDAYDLRRGEIIIDPPAVQTDLSTAVGLFEPGMDLFDITGAGTATGSFAPANVDPGLGHARSLTVRIIDGNTTNLVVSSVTFVGTNQRGETVFTSYVPTAPFGGTDTVDVPFRTLERVTAVYANAEDNQDSIEIGVGEWFGLSAPFPTASEAQADRAFHIVAVGTALDGSPSGASFLDPQDNPAFETSFGIPDQQAVRFPGNVPDGTTDYIVQFEPLSDIRLDVSVDTFVLSAGGGDTANMTADVQGGVPPYDYELSASGTFGAPGGGALAFNPTGPFNDVPGDLPSNGQLQVQASGTVVLEVHFVRVLVTDSVGNRAVGTAPVVLIP